jgi:hypothetical protein
VPHRCPMAIALSERRRVRNIQAIAERPDGTRIKFQPYPTPLFNEDGEISGGVNLLIELSESQPAHTIKQAH